MSILMTNIRIEDRSRGQCSLRNRNQEDEYYQKHSGQMAVFAYEMIDVISSPSNAFCAPLSRLRRNIAAFVNRFAGIFARGQDQQGEVR